METENQVIIYSANIEKIEDWKKMYSGLKIEGEGKERKESYNVVKDAYTFMKDQRLTLEDERVEKKAPSLAFGKKVDLEAKSLKILMDPIESELKETKAAEDNVEKERKAAEAKKEQERIDSIRKIIDTFDFDIHGCLSDYNASSETIQKFIDDVGDVEITEDRFQEFLPEMEMKVVDALEKLNAAYDKKVTQEKQAAEIESQRLKNEEIAKEQAEKQKKIDEKNQRVADEQKAAQDKIDATNKKKANDLAKEKADFEADKLKNVINNDHLEALSMNSEFDKKKAIQDKIDAENKTKEVEEKNRQDKIKDEEDAKKAKAKADQDEADRLKKEKLEEERKELLRSDKDKLINFFFSLSPHGISLKNDVSNKLFDEFEAEYNILVTKYTDRTMEEL